MKPVVDRIDYTIQRDPAAYSAHPCLTRLTNGDLLVAFNESPPRRPWLHPPDEPRTLCMVTRSRDGGVTWTAPRAAPTYAMTGVECPSISQTRTGEVLLIQWRFGWFPLETARKRARASGYTERFVIAGSGRAESAPAATESDWAAARLPWARTDAGLFTSVSTDDGETWDQTQPACIAPFARGYSPRPPAQLRDGGILLALASHDERGILFTISSTDGGRSWSAPPVIVSQEVVLSEPSILELSDGKLLVLARHDASGYLWQVESLDRGETWSAPRELPVRGYPPHLLELADRRVLVVYGYRRAPFGIRACLSNDGGATWDVANELTIRDDLINANLGYPTAVQLPNGIVFTAYYAEDTNGVTHVCGSAFKVPD